MLKNNYVKNELIKTLIKKTAYLLPIVLFLSLILLLVVYKEDITHGISSVVIGEIVEEKNKKQKDQVYIRYTQLKFKKRTNYQSRYKPRI